MISSTNNSFWATFIFIKKYIVRHLKLEITLEISALNECKIETNNLAAPDF